MIVLRCHLGMLLLLIAASVQAEVAFDFVRVGNAGNAPDPLTGFGAVPYEFAISTREVTVSQYVEFLNAAAATDPHRLYYDALSSGSIGGVNRPGLGGILRHGEPGSYTYSIKPPIAGRNTDGSDYSFGKKPIVALTISSVMRFVNWLHNGQGSGDTETGVYTIGNGLNETRTADARFWLPSEDEWYKAAYHDATAGAAGVYYGFATMGNTAPNNNIPSEDTGASANYRDGSFTTGLSYPLTDTGAYSLSASPYGTYDQNGNVGEWNDSIIDGRWRSYRGGSFIDTATLLKSENRRLTAPDSAFSSVSFRVATIVAVPEPGAVFIGLVALCGVWLHSARRQAA